MQTGTKLLFIFGLVSSFLFFTGCSEQEKDVPKQITTERIIQEDGQAVRLTDDPNVYIQDDETPIAYMYVTVVADQEEQTTFYQVNHPAFSEEDAKVKVIFQEGTEEGPQPGFFGYGQNRENAMLETRGQSTRSHAQKSYKVKLQNSAGLWRNQEVINLNKHPYEATRVRNKLSFDYFRLIPDMTSLRTQFVHLFVKDQTANPPDTDFRDLGLFTQIEQANKRFLGSHGLDPNGYLYKSTMFEFYRYADELYDVTDPQYKKEAFESVLEIKGRADHAKLIDMLEDVNKSTSDFNKVFDKHFDRDNYLTWVGMNILFGNIDTRTQNYYLYSPLNHPKWYFLPWDYDGGWGYHEDDMLDPSRLGEWEFGLANYWGSVLHQRFFKDPQNVEALDAKNRTIKGNRNPGTNESYA